MAACAATHHLKIQNQPTSITATTKPKRRKCREIIISSSDTGAAAPPTPSPPARLAYQDLDLHSDTNFHRGISSNTSQASYQKAELSPSRPKNHPPMEFSCSPSNGGINDVVRTFPSGFTKFNSALTAGLLNPMSPPPPIARSSPTLFEMMVNEPDPHSRVTTPPQANPAAVKQHQNAAVSAVRERHFQMQQRIAEMLGNRSPGNMFNDSESGDIKLTLSDKDGFSVGVSVHRQILVANSVFFAGRLSERWTKQQGGGGAPFEVEISDCDDVEVYVETLRLMYCKDLRRMLMKEDVPKVLGILKISAAIGFNAGVFSCLEYLEAAPWEEDEEEKVTSLLSELRLENFGANEVLKRIFIDLSSSTENNNTEEVLKKLLQVVLEGKDDKARREMKNLFLKMLRENTTHNDISKESLYLACEGCLHQLKHHFFQASASNLEEVSQIARQADNLHWLLDILIDRQIADEFVKTWGSQTEMSNAHQKVPSVHRYEVSRVTARLFVGIGKGQVLASQDSRFLLLKTWLGPFYDDFGWMKRASNGLDRHVIEDGLSNTILTLPLSWQQEVLLAWFDRFLNSGEDCPNIQRGFEVWWRRAFWRRNGDHDKSRVRVMNAENA
ncbi:hypothetical protein V2J09_020233 [Rumex salicifolius]